jgi:hypothetical protein
VNELVSLKPTSSPISVTDSLRSASKLLAFDASAGETSMFGGFHSTANLP